MKMESDLLFTDANCNVSLSGHCQEMLDGHGPQHIGRKKEIQQRTK